MTLWVRYRHGNSEGFGALDGGRVHVHAGDVFAAPIPTGEVLVREQVTLLPPVRPGVFIGLWNNFGEAAARQGLARPEVPLWFVKSPRALSGPDAPIPMPGGYGGRVVYEGEVGLVIGRRCARATEASAAEAIFGLTCVNDVTALDLLTADASFAQWARAKGCDGFGPIGPAIATGLDWSSLRVKVALNGRVRQDYPLSDMIIPPGRVVSMISQEMTLEPGDVIACGTSVGVLPMKPGTTVEVTIEGIGTLRNVFASADPPGVQPS